MEKKYAKSLIRLSAAAFLFFSAPANAFSQVSQQWVSRYANTALAGMQDQAKAMAVDDSGNVYVTGFSFTHAAGQGEDYLTIKYDSAGNTLWERRYDGPSGLTDKANDIAIDHDGNIVVTGSSKDSVAYYEAATLKYDPAGNVLWTQRFSVAGPIGVHGEILQTDAVGNIYVTGTGGYDSTDNDFITLKYSTAGALLWTAVYDGPKKWGDRPTEMHVDKWGGVYVTGQSTSDTVWSHSYSGGAFTTVKYDSAGNQQWIKRFSGTYGLNSSRGMAIDDSGNVYVTGDMRETGTGDYSDIMTIKYNADGEMQWLRTFEGPAAAQDRGDFINVDKAGNVYVLGSSVTDPVESFPQADLVLIKYNAGGAQQWARYYTALPACGSCLDVPGGMTLDTAGNVYIAAGVTLDTPFMTFRDYATIKFDAMGNQQWVQLYNGTGQRHDDPTDITVDKMGNVYVTGISAGVGSVADDDYVTIKYSQSPMPVGAGQYAVPSLVVGNYPNPFSAVTAITYQLAQKAYVTLDVFDVVGKKVTTLVSRQQEAGSHTATFVPEALLPAGVYFYKLHANDASVTRRMSYVK